MPAIKTLTAICNREFLDHRVGYFWVPLVILSLILIVFIMGVLDISQGRVDGKTLGEFIAMISRENGSRENIEMSRVVALAYWGIGSGAFVALPFVVYFTLSSALYDERKDRSVLFLKSMPVADWQEVLGKLLTICLIGPLVYIGLVIIFQLVFAAIASLASVLNGGEFLIFWPLLDMVELAIAQGVGLISYFLWALPVFAWILFASSVSPKVPFLFAALPIFVIALLENRLLGTYTVLYFIGEHLSAGFGEGAGFTEVINYEVSSSSAGVKGPEDVIEQLTIGRAFTGLAASFANLKFWLGIGIGAIFLLGATEMRRRSI